MDTPGWTAIRPWIPPLSLSVREITSVSVTFILSASSTPLAGDPDLAALGLSIEDSSRTEEDDDEDGDSTTNSESETKKSPSIVSRALAGGLSVEVDRAAWRRVFIRIDDKADEAVIIVYGLMPGRQYDVDLELVQGQTMSRQVITQDDGAASTTSTDTDTSNTAVGAEDGTPTRPNTPPPNSNGSPSQTPNGQSPQHQPSTPFTFAPLTLEDRIAQLQHTLSLLNSDTATLTASLKTARRDSQKADAALRSEIEVLKRTSERHAAGELRMKQKVLALQEAVKRTNGSVTEIKAEIVSVEESIPEHEKARGEKEEEYKRVLAEAEKMHTEREREEEVLRKRVDGLRNEYNTLGKAHEKLEMKQEKLEGGLVKELQDKLDVVERELEELEMEESIHLHQSRLQGMGLGPIRSQAPSEVGTIGRPSGSAGAIPIQRPTNASLTSLGSTKTRTPATSPKQAQNQSQSHPTHAHNHSLPHSHHLQPAFSHSSNSHNHSQRSASISHSHHHHHHHLAGPHSHGPHGPHHNVPVRHHPPTILMNPNRRQNSNSANSTAAVNSEGLDVSGSGGGASTSTLSSRAAPFEPGKGFGVGLLRTSGNSKTRGG
ncbi:hypothetical protein VNI00_011545 [Paramarasmius palmivorus]|uniref:Uncharacterized protein n=1 Tax=Paramarasmius palmivorus TaxID=297713 RepID=A0AAW0CA98_9AGAR